ncbi:hypothetical protein ACTQ49_02490 [Luteococcus sp. Sow4_B9]|uniref:hypothetical protein n=1 Tax=Luteococcus sp. Sow4_B9 TaxID=3438792 RepID=UPI003F9B9E8E
MTAHDSPVVAGSLFAERLSRGIRDRGLPLQRIKAKLQEDGLAVSVATLSYWSSGRSRPTRRTSRPIVQKLEEVLQLEPGYLVDAMPGADRMAALERIAPEELIRVAFDELGIARNPTWETLAGHQIVKVGSDRAEKGVENRDLSRATVTGQQKWALVLADCAGPIVCEETTACRLARQVDLTPDITIFEFMLDRPLEQGESVLTTQRLSYHGNGDPLFRQRYAVTENMDRLVLEVLFEDELPRKFYRTFAEDGSEEEQIVSRPVYSGLDCLQVVIDKPAPGVHGITWEW